MKRTKKCLSTDLVACKIRPMVDKWNLMKFQRFYIAKETLESETICRVREILSGYTSDRKIIFGYTRNFKN